MIVSGYDTLVSKAIQPYNVMLAMIVALTDTIRDQPKRNLFFTLKTPPCNLPQKALADLL